MSQLDLTQQEADQLLSMEKMRVDDQSYDYPQLGGRLNISLLSRDKREQFMIDISRGHIELSKNSFQNRARKAIILARLDLGGSPHRNPDDKELECPHLHLYREGYGVKWAYPVPNEIFNDISNICQTLDDFMRYCNITEPPIIDRGLFT